MPRTPRFVPPGQGREYPMGRMHAVFKADNDETDGAASVSEWWLEANTEGPPVHDHPEDHVFYIIAGVMTLLLDGERIDAAPGSYALIPGGTPHSFENRGAERAGLISFNTPGGFEDQARPIMGWLASNPLGDVER